MASSLLWLPDGHAPGTPGPAFVFVHRWGGYPHDPLARHLGPELASRGFALLSVCLRRRGMEGQLTSNPMDDIRDTKLAVDYLDTNGFDSVFLIGEEIGGHSILRYHAATTDMRVRGLALVNPVESRTVWLRSCVDPDTLQQAFSSAAVAMRQGAGMDTRIDLKLRGGPAVTQKAGAFLSWWGDGERHAVRTRCGGCAGTVACGFR